VDEGIDEASDKWSGYWSDIMLTAPLAVLPEARISLSVSALDDTDVRVLAIEAFRLFFLLPVGGLGFSSNISLLGDVDGGGVTSRVVTPCLADLSSAAEVEELQLATRCRTRVARDMRGLGPRLYRERERLFLLDCASVCSSNASGADTDAHLDDEGLACIETSSRPSFTSSCST
jgi:hypothetical protein